MTLRRSSFFAKIFAQEHDVRAGLFHHHVIALMEPDMILLQPTLAEYGHSKNMQWVGTPPRYTKVAFGHPIAQKMVISTMNGGRSTRHSSFPTFCMC